MKPFPTLKRAQTQELINKTIHHDLTLDPSWLDAIQFDTTFQPTKSIKSSEILKNLEKLYPNTTKQPGLDMFTDDHIKHLTCNCNWPWHEQVLSHDRSHQIKRILESFFPQTSGQVSVSDDSEVAIRELVVFAKVTENEVYGEVATVRSKIWVRRQNLVIF